MDLLRQAWSEASLPSEREHVTMFMRNRPERFHIGSFKGNVDRSAMRWTVDEPEDLNFVRAIYQRLYLENPAFSSSDVYSLLHREPDLLQLNRRFNRNEGLQHSLLQDCEWKKAHENRN
jgi:spore coat polysaccharide biosynthesis protein SpsF (cytidylyltransferase family)